MFSLFFLPKTKTGNAAEVLTLGKHFDCTYIWWWCTEQICGRKWYLHPVTVLSSSLSSPSSLFYLTFSQMTYQSPVAASLYPSISQETNLIFPPTESAYLYSSDHCHSLLACLFLLRTAMRLTLYDFCSQKWLIQEENCRESSSSFGSSHWSRVCFLPEQRTLHTKGKTSVSSSYRAPICHALVRSGSFKRVQQGQGFKPHQY